VGVINFTPLPVTYLNGAPCMGADSNIHWYNSREPRNKNDKKDVNSGGILIKKKEGSLFMEKKVGSIFENGHFWIFKNVQNGFLEEVIKRAFF